MKLPYAFSFIFLLIHMPRNQALNNETDKIALLKLKASISDDPNLVLSSWNNSVHFCRWNGVSCGTRHQRVLALNLKGSELRGTLSPFLGNLSFLRYLNLQNNFIAGNIPKEITRLLRLRYLNLGNNTLEGNIPANLSRCSRLELISLGRNNLSGIVPSELGSLLNLEGLYLSINDLSGGIPASLGNISSLKVLSLGYNGLVGTIPGELGTMKSLTTLTIGLNKLTGTVPLSLFNMSSLSIFGITRNLFEGTLPSNLGLTLPSLQLFEIAGNRFTGTIPESFSNASQLERLDMSNNNFFGQVPLSFGSLRSLAVLGLSNNSLGMYSENSLDFISYLTNCSQMKYLDLSLNNFRGVLPNSIANFSSNFTGLYLGSNEIEGNIPDEFENLVGLTVLSLEFNKLSGEISTSLGRLRNLKILDFQGNSFSGNIPTSLSNLTGVFELDLSSNNLHGNIPPSLQNCTSLQQLDLSNNRLTGVIPVEIFDILSLTLLLDLSKNSLTGSLPIEVGKLTNVIAIDLSENNLTNEIPGTIGKCESLTALDFHGNFFRGSLPSTLSSLKGLEFLDLSSNNLTGKIPKELEKLKFLAYLNISFNDLDGEVPIDGVFRNMSAISLAGNANLCGGVPMLKLPRCLVVQAKQQNATKARLFALIVTFCMVGLLLAFLALAIRFWRRKSAATLSSISTIGFLSKVSYKMLFEATDGFSTNMLIGAGSFGSVYKAFVGENNNPFAVKVLNLHRKGAEKSFIAECNTLRNVRHRNLVKLLTCCASTDYNRNDFKALVYEFMPNGSLDNWLHDLVPENQQTGLSLIQRLNIALDVASAIYYLHEDCDQPVIHRDLKPSNVLLDEEMVARVSDFGLAKLISNTIGRNEGETSTIGIKGTVGYAAPEYAMGGESSKDGDVYSYGILVLEMFTGKRPTDDMFRNDFNLRKFVEISMADRLEQIVDSSLLRPEIGQASTSRGDEIEEDEENISNENTILLDDRLIKCLISVLQIGLACSRDSPNERMNMGDVTRELLRIRSAFMAGELRER